MFRWNGNVKIKSKGALIEGSLRRQGKLQGQDDKGRHGKSPAQIISEPVPLGIDWPPL